MTQAAEKVIADFMALDADERELVAVRLFDAMHEGARDPGYEEAWDAEIQRRIDQIDRGESKMIPMDEAMKMIGRGHMDEEG
jgi:putative addiction module component (TIGR02574 family)